jgi:hypothetical protein
VLTHAHPSLALKILYDIVIRMCLQEVASQGCCSVMALLAVP